MNGRADYEAMRQMLCAFHDYLRETICHARDQNRSGEMAQVAAHTLADVVYAIDKVSEAAILDWFATHWPADWPVQIIMEGIEDDDCVTFPKGLNRSQTQWICIIDPIDGTRNFMYDKRSAWILSGIAPQRGEATSLADICVAAMTELPTRKQWRSDQLSAVRGNGVIATATDRIRATAAPLHPKPATATDCRHAFASLVRFFPDGLQLTAAIEEALWQSVYPDATGGSPVVFNDQYISTGGQLYELIMGNDRFIADIRPAVFSALNLPASLACHPYDLAAMLVAQEAGVCIENPFTGQPVNAPLDTTTPVAWAAYANTNIANALRLPLQAAITKHLRP